MSRFDHMQIVADRICSSLYNEPHRWIITDKTIQHKTAFTNLKLLIGKYHIHTNVSYAEVTRVFSSKQGKQIYAAYLYAKDYQNTEKSFFTRLVLVTLLILFTLTAYNLFLK